MIQGAAAFVVAALWPRAAWAHAFAQRYDLPLPLWHYLAGAGAAVAVSFVVMTRLPAHGLLERSMLIAVVPRSVVRPLAALARGTGAAALVLLVAVGLLAEQGDWDSNLLPVAVWVLWWVGLTLVTMLLGPVWRLVDPWQAIAAHAIGRRAAGRPGRLARAGCWPAVVLFLCFTFAELVWTENAVPWKLATAVIAWSILALAGMAWWGRAAWRRHCDPFDRFFGLVARVSPLAWQEVAGGTALRLRWPGAGLLNAGRVAPPSQVAFILVMIATVSFDGLSETPLWEAVTGEALALLYGAGVVARWGYGVSGALIKSAGLLAVPLGFAALYLLACVATARIGREAPGTAACRFALSLVPIAVGYHLAHYLSYILVQGQAALPLMSDPFALGWNIFGTRGREVDIGVIDMRTVWLVAVLAIVAGHVVAVILAHAEASRAYGGRALASQIPMLVLMVGYTMLSLWILAQPIVNL